MAVTGQQVVDEAKRFLGVPYVYGKASPGEGFDCSGLVEYVLGQLGVKGVPRTSEAQWAWSQHIPQSQLQPGDLIFEQWPGDGSPPGHVVIYAGGGQVIEAPHTGASVRTRAWNPGETTIVGYGRPPGLAKASGAGASAQAGAGGGGSLLQLPGTVLQMFNDLEKVAQGMMWILNPESWARILSGVFGFVLLGFGLYFLVGAA